MKKHKTFKKLQKFIDLIKADKIKGLCRRVKMLAQIIYAYEEYLLLMEASLSSYELNQAAELYPPGYETSLKPVYSGQNKIPKLDIKLPYLQDPAVYTFLLSVFIFGSDNSQNKVDTEVIDRTENEEIEP